MWFIVDLSQFVTKRGLHSLKSTQNIEQKEKFSDSIESVNRLSTCNLSGYMVCPDDTREPLISGKMSVHDLF
jgi:hypothetical protein